MMICEWILQLASEPIEFLWNLASVSVTSAHHGRGRTVGRLDGRSDGRSDGARSRGAAGGTIFCRSNFEDTHCWL